MTSQSPGALFTDPNEGGNGGNGNPAAQWATGNQPAFNEAMFNPQLLQQHQQHQQQQLNLLQQQQQLAPLVGQQLNSLIPSNQQQGPTINMMLQAQGLGGMLQHPTHTLQSPPNSGGLFFLPQQQGGHGRMEGRPDIAPSPNSHPQPAATPPSDLDRNGWNPNGVPAFKNFVEDRFKPTGGDLFVDHTGGGPGGQPPPTPQEAQLAVQMAAAMNQFGQHFMVNPAGNAQSPPPPQFHLGNQQPMPPRPRPEGGQNPSPAGFLQQEQQQHIDSMKRNTDLVIDSWTNEDNEKANMAQQQQNSGFDLQGHGMMDELKDDNKAAFNVTGWGAPPPAQPGGWGGAGGGISSTSNKPMGHQQPNNWQQPPPSMVNQPPPHLAHQQPPPHMPPFGSDVGAGRGMHGGGFDRGRGGRGGMMTRQFEPNFERGRGRGRGMGGYRGRGGSFGGDHNQEKHEGKKSAISETIAMMKKMKMEDQERKEASEKKRKEMGVPSPPPEESDVEQYEERRAYGERGRGRGRGGYRGRGRGGGMPGGMGMMPHQPMGVYHQGPPPGAGMMIPPHGIPPFPGVEGFMPPGAMPGLPGTGFPPPFHPGMFPPGGPQGFPPGMGARGGGFPRGGGGPRGAMFNMGGFPPLGRGFGGPRGGMMGGMGIPGAGGPMRGGGGPRGARGGRGGRGSATCGYKREDQVGGPDGEENDGEIVHEIGEVVQEPVNGDSSVAISSAEVNGLSVGEFSASGDDGTVEIPAAAPIVVKEPVSKELASNEDEGETAPAAPENGSEAH